MTCDNSNNIDVYAQVWSIEWTSSLAAASGDLRIQVVKAQNVCCTQSQRISSCDQECSATCSITASIGLYNLLLSTTQNSFYWKSCKGSDKITPCNHARHALLQGTSMQQAVNSQSTTTYPLWAVKQYSLKWRLTALPNMRNKLHTHLPRYHDKLYEKTQ